MTSERKNEMLSNDNVIPRGFCMEKALKIAKRSVKKRRRKVGHKNVNLRKNQSRLTISNFYSHKIQLRDFLLVVEMLRKETLMKNIIQI